MDQAPVMLAEAVVANEAPGIAVPDVSVVICAYTVDRWAELQRAVRSVLSQRRAVREVIVVIDHNTELLGRAQAFWTWCEPSGGGSGSPAVRVLASTGAPGLSGARNTGVEASSAEIVAFLDDDAKAHPGWIDKLLDAYTDPLVVGCGGATMPALATARPDWWPLEFDWVVGCSYIGLPQGRAFVRNLIGANMSIRRSAIVAVGGFAEGIGRVGSRPLGCEETDLCIRIGQRWPEARIVYEPDARVLHTVPPGRLSWRYFTSRCFAEGLSKASITARSGTRRGLASERSYVVKVLPAAIARELAAACHGKRGAARQAVAVAFGFATTVFGYVVGRFDPSRCKA